MHFRIIEKHSFEWTNTVQNLLLSPGIWLFELWGAQGGCLNENRCLGGYATGQIMIWEKTEAFIYVGGKGSFSSIEKPLGGFNGGGDGYLGEGMDGIGTGIGGSGGGGTDVRFHSDNLSSRIIVAGGGGGQGGWRNQTLNGGNGGGKEGEDGEKALELPLSNGKKGTINGNGEGGTMKK